MTFCLGLAWLNTNHYYIYYNNILQFFTSWPRKEIMQVFTEKALKTVVCRFNFNLLFTWREETTNGGFRRKRRSRWEMVPTKYKLRLKSLSLICMGLELSGDRQFSPYRSVIFALRTADTAYSQRIIITGQSCNYY